MFIAEARRLCDRAGARIVNVDSTGGLQRPKLAPQIPQMCEALAKALGCDAAQVSVKAKTAEGLGAVGEGGAVEARAIVQLEFPKAVD